MLSRFRAELRRPSPAFVLAAIALFVALGGTGAYAIDRVTSKEIGNREVKRVDIARNAVVGKKVAKESLKGSDIDVEPRVVTEVGTIPANGGNDIIAECENDEVVSGGGWTFPSRNLTEESSTPWPANEGESVSGWLVGLANPSNQQATATAVALCVPE
jgi:hypothetical protein